MLPVVFHEAYVAQDIPAHHRFPMGKFRAVAERVIALGLVEGWTAFHKPIPAPPAWLELAHDRAYVAAVIEGSLDPAAARRIGFKMSAPVAMRSRCAVAGTILAARLALEHGAACNTAGGSHHADRHGGAGFCVFNDVGVAGKLLLEEGLIRRALVIDLDVHQGDGTARIFQDDPRVFTLSLHCGTNWPRRKAASDMDVDLPAGAGDEAYISAVREAVETAFDASRPDLVFYNAGVDPHREDRLGLLELSDAGLRARDRMVARAALERDVPLCGVLGGGYSRDLDVLARRHAYLNEAAAEAMRAYA